MAIKDIIDNFKLRHYYKKMTKGFKKAGVTSVDELYGGKPVEEKPKRRTIKWHIGVRIKRWKSRQDYKKSIREGVKSGLIQKTPSKRQTNKYIEQLNEQNKKFIDEMNNKSSGS